MAVMDAAQPEKLNRDAGFAGLPLRTSLLSKPKSRDTTHYPWQRLLGSGSLLHQAIFQIT